MAKKRGNGEGSITYHKASKRYIGQYTKPNGKRGAVYGKTRAEVKEKLIKVLAEIQTHTYTEKNDITLLELVKSIVEDKYNLNKIGESTYRTDLDTIKRLESDEIGGIKIQKMTTEHLKEYHNRMVNKYEYSNTIIHKNYGLINQALRKSVAKGYIRYNLLENKEELSKPKSKKMDKVVCSFTVKEQEKFLEALKSYENTTYKNIMLLALFTGMRSGEILALKLSDIDFENNVIHIQRSMTRNKEGKTIIGKKTKTYNSRRDITMTDTIKKILKDSVRNFKFNEEKLLFSRKNVDDDKYWISGSMINSAFKRLCQKHNVGKGFDVNFHMLRHTYATRCIESGMQAKVLQKKLGHKDISVTLNTYTDIFAKFEDKFDKQFMDYLEAHNIAI